ncbi:MAG TPA: hypothetical protein VHM26_00620 [Chitinophagaceae bacterium]|jgi:hypothetical protein|nr:hypothetical protein [Chitinophagaceae bacterium]
MKKRESKIIFPNGKPSKPIITDDVPSYKDHPFFVKKSAAAKAFLKKAGLPEELKNRKAKS